MDGFPEEASRINTLDKTKDLSAQGDTVLYGEMLEIDKAFSKIWIKTIDDQLIYCSITKELAQKAEARMHTQVALSGVAEWNIESLKVESFNATEILDYEQTSISRAFAELSEDFGKSFDSIPDVERFIREMRYRE